MEEEGEKHSGGAAAVAAAFVDDWKSFLVFNPFHSPTMSRQCHLSLLGLKRYSLLALSSKERQPLPAPPPPPPRNGYDGVTFPSHNPIVLYDDIAFPFPYNDIPNWLPHRHHCHYRKPYVLQMSSTLSTHTHTHTLAANISFGPKLVTQTVIVVHFVSKRVDGRFRDHTT